MNEADRDAELAQHRREKFRVEVAPSWHVTGEICLSVTQNGYQWQTIAMTREELDKVIDALVAYRSAL